MKKIVASSTVHRHSRLRHPDVHQHGVPTQTSINLCKSFLAYETLYWPESWRITYLSRFLSQILDYIYYAVLISLFFDDVTVKTSNQQETFPVCVAGCGGSLNELFCYLVAHVISHGGVSYDEPFAYLIMLKVHAYARLCYSFFFLGPIKFLIFI